MTMQSADLSYNVPPFPAFPATSRYIPLGSVQEALGRVCRSIDAREAVSLVVGPPGTGKSLICGLLVEHYRASHEVVILGETTLANTAALLRHLLHHLSVDLSATPDGDLQLALKDRVCGQESPEGGLLIIIDEAQSLSTEVIESVRMVTNIMRDGEPRVTAVLCGGVKLDETLVETSMEAFTQRVATRCYLHPMNGEETRHYVTETIRNCGAEPDHTITDEAVAAVHHACSGVPRLVNQILTQAIDCAEEADQARITEQIIDRAWAQLQQLPSPMVEEPKIALDSAPIEFGELDDSISSHDWPLQDCSTPTPTDQPQQLDSDEQPESITQQPGCEPSTPCPSAISGEADSYVEDDIQCDSESDLVVEQTGDIVVEESTALWVDDVDADVPEQGDAPADPPATSPRELFGEFDVEEEVSVGSGFAPVQPTATPANPPADLESMLHQEIVGINSLEEGRDAWVEEPSTAMEETETDDFEEQPEECVEDFVTVDSNDMDCHQDVDNPVLWLADESENPNDADAVPGDDSDLLVIEDEVELRRIDAAKLDAQDQTISVDFQAMLCRMRSGT